MLRVGEQQFGLGIFQHRPHACVRIAGIQAHVNFPGLEDSQDHCNQNGLMFEQERNRFFAFPEMRQDSASDTISGSVQHIVSEFMLPGFDRDSVWIHPHDLLKALWNRLLDFFLRELDEGSARMKTLLPNSLLPRRKVYGKPTEVTHKYS